MDTLPATINGFFCRDAKDVQLAQKIIDPATTRASYAGPRTSQFSFSAAPQPELWVNRPNQSAARGAVVNLFA